MRAETLSIHGGLPAGESPGGTVVPIHQTVSYPHRTAEQLADVFAGRGAGYIYTRIANPTTAALENRLTELEEGIGSIATSSGMAAISAVATGLLETGAEVVSSRDIFGGTASLFKNILGRFGVKTRFVDSGNTGEFADNINENTRFVFTETIGNPGMTVPDIPAVAQIAHDANIPLVVDSTVTSPAIFQPGKFGADIVVHSSSKFINGHGTAIGGAITDTGNYDWSNGVFEDIRQLAGQVRGLAFLSHLRNSIYRDLGGCPAPMNSFLMLQGLETLGYRMDVHCRNAAKLADFLQGYPEVRWVNYPGLKTSRYSERAKRLFAGYGGALLTFGLGDRQKAFKFINSLKLAKNAANLGDAKTLVIHPGSTIFHEFSAEQREAMGIADDMVRVSVGIENYEDIQKDFEQALNKIFEV